ncbi:uncharacterized protein B0H18DRAFT_1011557, partial [Fomitopsis serialis]|uniref:uncharacterized protein n=1 Tax=Fomitopsis serialis TaxID=139415 RepID=UPI002007FB27
ERHRSAEIWTVCFPLISRFFIILYLYYHARYVPTSDHTIRPRLTTRLDCLPITIHTSRL